MKALKLTRATMQDKDEVIRVIHPRQLKEALTQHERPVVIENTWANFVLLRIMHIRMWLQKQAVKP